MIKIKTTLNMLNMPKYISYHKPMRIKWSNLGFDSEIETLNKIFKLRTLSLKASKIFADSNKLRDKFKNLSMCFGYHSEQLIKTAKSLATISMLDMTRVNTIIEQTMNNFKTKEDSNSLGLLSKQVLINPGENLHPNAKKANNMRMFFNGGKLYERK